MGDTLSAILDKPETTEVEDFLDTSMELMYAKRDNFFRQNCVDQDFNKMVPIQKVFLRQSQIRISIDQTMHIGQEIANVAKRFMSGEYAEAIGDTISVATTALFGQYHGSYMTKNKYAISIGSQGGIKRIDSLIYLKKVKGEKLKSVVKNIYMVCYQISSVNTQNMTENDIRVLVDISFTNEEVKEKLTRKFLEQLFPDKYHKEQKPNQVTTNQ